MNKPGLSMDIGGTLAKLVVYIPDKLQDSKFADFFLRQEPSEANAVIEEDLEIQISKGKIYFVKFLSADVPKFLNSENFNYVVDGINRSALYATGGGAYKYAKYVKKKDMKITKMNELDCLVHGLRVIMKRTDGCFTLSNARFGGDIGQQRSKLLTVPITLSPKKGVIVVNIGSGVSILHVTKDSYERVGGSSLGGSTFLGLVALLTGCDKFDEALDLAANGDSARCDMLVKDIYGDMEEDNDASPQEKLLFNQLRPTTLASSFGKMIDSKARAVVRKEDLALSTLVMCSMNLAGIAQTHAKKLGVKHIIFTGNFLATSEGLRTPNGKKNTESIHMHVREKLSLHKRNTISMRVLSYAVSFWSEDKLKAVFLKHEGCLGALGALLKGTGLKLPKTSYESSRL